MCYEYIIAYIPYNFVFQFSKKIVWELLSVVLLHTVMQSFYAELFSNYIGKNWISSTWKAISYPYTCTHFRKSEAVMDISWDLSFFKFDHFPYLQVQASKVSGFCRVANAIHVYIAII